MRKRLTAAIVAGSLGLVGAAVAVPALADSPSPSASPTPSAGPNGGLKAPSVADRTARIRQQLQSLVDDKTITADQAAKIAAKLAQSGGAGRGGGGGFRHGPGMMGAVGPESLAAVATVLGLSEDDVRSALAGGTTLAELAKKQGKSEDAVIAAIVGVAKQRIAEAVKVGRLTQDQADRMTSTLQQRVKDAVENGRPEQHRFNGRRFGNGAPGGGGPTPTSPPSSGSSTQGSGFAA